MSDISNTPTGANTMTTPTTPLTDAELDYVQDACGPVASRAAAEIRALRAQQSELVAVLIEAMTLYDRVVNLGHGVYGGAETMAAARKAIARAEGRG